MCQPSANSRAGCSVRSRCTRARRVPSVVASSDHSTFDGGRSSQRHAWASAADPSAGGSARVTSPTAAPSSPKSNRTSPPTRASMREPGSHAASAAGSARRAQTPAGAAGRLRAKRTWKDPSGATPTEPRDEPVSAEVTASPRAVADGLQVGARRLDDVLVVLVVLRQPRLDVGAYGHEVLALRDEVVDDLGHEARG